MIKTINRIKNLTKTIQKMKTIDDRQIRKIKIFFHKLRVLNSQTVRRGIQILTESPEEYVRAEEDKPIIRFEEDQSLNHCFPCP
jgi:hypothetical protein